MQEQKTVINPYFQTFLDRSNLCFQYFNLFFAGALVLSYFAGFMFMTKMGIITSLTFIIFIIFVLVVTKKGYFPINKLSDEATTTETEKNETANGFTSEFVAEAVVFRNINILKLLVNTFVSFALMIVITVLFLYATKSEYFTEILFPGLKGVVLEDIIYVISTVEFLILTTSFLLGFFTVVRDIFNVTITSVKIFSTLKSDITKENIKKIVFGAFILVAVILVYIFLGEELFDYASDLLENVESVQIIFLLVLVGYYLKVLVKGSPVIDRLDSACCK